MRISLLFLRVRDEVTPGVADAGGHRIALDMSEAILKVQDLNLAALTALSAAPMPIPSAGVQPPIPISSAHVTSISSSVLRHTIGSRRTVTAFGARGACRPRSALVPRRTGAATE